MAARSPTPRSSRRLRRNRRTGARRRVAIWMRSPRRSWGRRSRGADRSVGCRTDTATDFACRVVRVTVTGPSPRGRAGKDDRIKGGVSCAASNRTIREREPRWASAAPSRVRAYTRSGRFRARVASNPSSTNWRRIRATVVGWRSSAPAIAASAQAAPPSPWSALSRTRARVSMGGRCPASHERAESGTLGHGQGDRVRGQAHAEPPGDRRVKPPRA